MHTFCCAQEGGRERGEVGLAVDCFDLQQFNLDGSGKGVYEEFMANIRKFAPPQDPDLAQLRVLKGDSQALTPEDLLAAAGGEPRTPPNLLRELPKVRLSYDEHSLINSLLLEDDLNYTKNDLRLHTVHMSVCVTAYLRGL